MKYLASGLKKVPKLDNVAGQQILVKLALATTRKKRLQADKILRQVIIHFFILFSDANQYTYLKYGFFEGHFRLDHRCLKKILKIPKASPKDLNNPQRAEEILGMKSTIGI